MPDMTAAEIATKASALRAEADRAHSGLTQYAGYWDTYTDLVEVTKAVRTKLGTAFEAGELAISDPAPTDREWPAGYVACYSVRNRITTSVPADKVRAVRPKCADAWHQVCTECRDQASWSCDQPRHDQTRCPTCKEDD